MGVFDSSRKICDLPINVVGKCGILNCPEADHQIVPNTGLIILNKFLQKKYNFFDESL